MKAPEEGLCRQDSNVWNTRPSGNTRIKSARMQEPDREGLASQAKHVEPLESLGKVLNGNILIGIHIRVVWQMEGREPDQEPFQLSR